jgi:pilin isopeptide linkage protein/LPXTG-motif cell wall-anchored protein
VDEDGTLVATPSYEGSQTFTNEYQPAAGSVVLQANKVLTGRSLQAGEFSFVLKDENGEAIETVNNDGTGAVNFSAITYDQAGTYTYTISEVAGNETGISYDDHVINVTVDVVDEDGTLVATPSYEGSQTFTNEYQPAAGSVVLQANKVLTGRSLQAGEFSFVLKDENGEAIETVNNDGTGAVNFSAIDYDQAGTYTYTISEVAGNETGISYDDHVINVTVDVVDEDGTLVATPSYEGSQTFTNKYQPTRKDPPSKPTNTSNGNKTLPKTNEQSSLWLVVIGLLILVAVIFIVVKRRKKD